MSLDQRIIEEMKRKLSDNQLDVCFRRGTEPPGSGKYLHTKEPGVYHCAVCGQVLFLADEKYDSKTGWPAFWDAVDQAAVTTVDDNSMGLSRTEVQCANCGAHLGHVFPDGPKPTGLRYCINSLALDFRPDKSE